MSFLNRHSYKLVVSVSYQCQYCRTLGTKSKDSSRTGPLLKFIDKVRIRTTGGKGGDGCVSFESHDGPGSKRPSGGHGGAGGNVYIVADKRLRSLNFEQHHYNAAHGANGGASGRKGKRGENRYLRVPCGTVVTEIRTQEAAWKGWDFIEDSDEISNEIQENANNLKCIEDGEFGSTLDNDDDPFSSKKADSERMRNFKISCNSMEVPDEIVEDDISEEKVEDVPLIKADLGKDGDSILAVSGGRPGLGNQIMGGSRKHKSMSPKKLPGTHGESREFVLELKTIADVGLVGYPNAGKSTLLGVMSHAKPATAAYPFTTLHPKVGHLEYSDARQITLADIPGLIKGAHMNKGLGHEFLRHIERTKALIYVIDIGATDGRDPCQDFMSLRDELSHYNDTIMLKPSLVIANKIDEPGSEEHLERLKQLAHPLQVLPVCAFFGEGIENVAVEIRVLVELTEKYSMLFPRKTDSYITSKTSDEANEFN